MHTNIDNKNTHTYIEKQYLYNGAGSLATRAKRMSDRLLSKATLKFFLAPFVGSDIATITSSDVDSVVNNRKHTYFYDACFFFFFF